MPHNTDRTMTERRETLLDAWAAEARKHGYSVLVLRPEDMEQRGVSGTSPGLIIYDEASDLREETFDWLLSQTSVARHDVRVRERNNED